MQRSEHRILTTHAGSLPRPPHLVELLARLNHHEPVDPTELANTVEEAVPDVVARQIDAGIDIGNDGEQGRESFFTYVQYRMTGFGGAGDEARNWQDIADFPGFADIRRQQRSNRPQVSLVRPPKAIGDIQYLDKGAVEADCRRLTNAATAQARTAGAQSADVHGFTETFLTSPSPGIVAAAMANAHYPTLEDYVNAVADALAVEYRGIIEAGHVLQIDAPDLAMERHSLFAARPLEDFLAFVDVVIAAINRAVTGLPARNIRLHVCWGNYGGPHTHDVPLAELLGHLYQANVGGLLLSMANPRHEHEYKELARNPLPNGWLLATGVIDVTTNYVEHPEVVADRLERVAEAIGDPTRILACTDCGFDTAAGFSQVALDVAWAKLRTMRAGADLASTRLF
ncbi:MAG: 5-methyltetrahydropteroyltriglutamate--homocysteine methyltransferase [Acidimicrobiia bacterium]|nr:5-methyltetrahydropteroyltriglutamate--homocysteine methyltransferase [Acidimicrobiia bacterium]